MNDPGREVLKHAVFIAGPTSSGKSVLAVEWARRHGGEIVCADAFQLYREFPILSAQPSEAEREGVPHHLFGAAGCADAMDAARYAQMALAVIAEIASRGRIPFVVGGSGLYIHALTSGLPDVPAIDPEIRERVRAMNLQDMVQALGELDPAALDIIDARNPRRVGRRLEICLQSGRPASEVLAPNPPVVGLRGIVLAPRREDLHDRITRAVEARLAGGAVDEVRAVRELAGLTARQILGWREITGFLDGALSLEECREQLASATRRYAKRQLTWFRSKLTLPPVDPATVTPEILERTARLPGPP